MIAHNSIIGEGLTYDDVLVPNYSNVLPREVSIQTKFSRNITLNVPIVSAAMDTKLKVWQLRGPRREMFVSI
jgi:IMP dehydrogenase